MKRVIHKSQGRTSGLGITAYFKVIFEANELLPPAQKLTDRMIAAKIAREFPDRPTAQDFVSRHPKKTINSYRYRYNRGVFTKGIPPTTYSFRYNKKGEKINGKTGTFVLTGKQVYHIMLEHANRRREVLESMMNG